jgi:hypothetical protein
MWTVYMEWDFFQWTDPSSREENQLSNSHGHKIMITGPTLGWTPQMTNCQLQNRLDMDIYRKVNESIIRNS